MDEKKDMSPATGDQRILDLLNGSIDGEISAADQEELDHLLASSPELSKLNDELRAVSRVLDDLPELEPPQYLKETIERQARLPVGGHTGSGKPGFFGGWLNANWLRTGAALAAGLVLTVGVYEMGSEPITTGDSTSMVGTMAKKGQADQQGTLLDSIHLDTKELKGLVELRNKDKLFTLDIQLSSDEPAELVVAFGGRGLEFEGVSPSQSQKVSVSVVNGSIHLVSSGERHFTLNLRHTEDTQAVAPLELEVFANSKLIQQTKLNVSQF
jgi:hypothetical protein